MKAALRQMPGSTLLLVGGGIVGALVVVAIFAPLLAPYDPLAVSGASLVSPSAHHLLGTNTIGQDIFSQIIWGARTSLVVGVGAAALVVAVGLLVGVGAGLIGGVVDTIAMRIVDLFMAIPVFPILVVVGALAGSAKPVVIVTIGFIGWRGTARVLRGQTLSLRQRGFIHAAQGFGGGPLYVIRRHLIPGLGPIIIADFVNWVSTAIVLESVLGLFGLGNPLEVSWGTIFNQAFLHAGVFFTPLWTWWLLPAVLAITVAVIGFALLGVGLEPIFNPRARRATNTDTAVGAPSSLDMAIESIN